jgi:hypothetical protein
MPTHLSVGDGTSRSCGFESVTRVYESDDELVVLVRLTEGVLELRVPRPAVASTPPRRANGINADATPC